MPAETMYWLRSRRSVQLSRGGQLALCACATYVGLSLAPWSARPDRHGATAAPAIILLEGPLLTRPVFLTNSEENERILVYSTAIASDEMCVLQNMSHFFSKFCRS